MEWNVFDKVFTIENGKVRVLSWNVSSLYPTVYKRGNENKVQMSSMYGKFDGGWMYKRGKFDGGWMYKRDSVGR